ncbi:hypothetical protein IEQ34_022422 [Dendrobium chrysotoxum]|uniref:Uncharacterized protein n=1 Tax=Dendrobium chrysotoxum TaxID=161865 RepID=A0AAV7FYX6_DENCH|nr:hypothetical protein IEQ34_022422 [Dendrobium chrysotoxum]
MEICGLKWSGSGNKLDSGGNDDLVHVWDCSMAASTTASSRSPWLHRFDEHTGAVRALEWCPFQRNLLATGDGEGDRCVRFWNTDTGNCRSSVDTSSQDYLFLKVAIMDLVTFNNKYDPDEIEIDFVEGPAASGGYGRLAVRETRGDRRWEGLGDAGGLGRQRRMMWPAARRWGGCMAGGWGGLGGVWASDTPLTDNG